MKVPRYHSISHGYHMFFFFFLSQNAIEPQLTEFFRNEVYLHLDFVWIIKQLELQLRKISLDQWQTCHWLDISFHRVSEKIDKKKNKKKHTSIISTEIVYQLNASFNLLMT